MPFQHLTVNGVRIELIEEIKLPSLTGRRCARVRALEGPRQGIPTLAGLDQILIVS